MISLDQEHSDDLDSFQEEVGARHHHQYISLWYENLGWYFE